MKTWKQIYTGGMLVLLLTGGITKAYADEIVGIVLEKRYTPGKALQVFLDTDGTLGADTMLQIHGVYNSGSASMALDMAIGVGSEIRFEDFFATQMGRFRQISGRDVISIDGDNVLDIVGLRYVSDYPFALHEYNRQRELEAQQRRQGSVAQ